MKCEVEIENKSGGVALTCHVRQQNTSILIWHREDVKNVITLILN